MRNMSPLKYARFFLGNLSAEFSTRDDGKPLDQLLREAKQYYDPLLPGNSDADTRLESVQVEGSRLVLESTLFTVTNGELDVEEFEGMLRDALGTEAHRRKRLFRILKKGGSLVYRYNDRNGAHVTEIPISE